MSDAHNYNIYDNYSSSDEEFNFDRDNTLFDDDSHISSTTSGSRSPIGFANADLLHMDTSDDFIINVDTENPRQGVEFTSSFVNAKWQDRQRYFSGILERIREEQRCGSSELPQSNLLCACFALDKGVGFMCWLTEGLDNIRSNAKAARLKKLGIQSDAQISRDSFARFIGTYLDISILTVSIQQCHRNPSGILSSGGNSSSPGSVSEDLRERHSAEQALYDTRVRYLLEITLCGCLNDLRRPSDEIEEVEVRS
jgi:hypothetical protein